MKTKLFAVAMAALMLATAGVASAQDYRGRPGDDRYGRDNQRVEITVRERGRTFTVNRRDRLFYRLTESPFQFRPGLTYVYTDECYRGQCRVLAFAPGYSRPVQTLRAPHVQQRADWNDRDGRGRNDDRWDDRDGRDDRGRDDRDGRGRGYQGDDSGLRGGPN